MTDQAAAPENQHDAAPAQEAPAAPVVDKGILASFKEKLFIGVNEAYSAFIQHHASLPVDKSMIATAFRHFNDGIVWIEKAINAIEALPFPEPVKEEAKAVEAVIEGVQALESAVEGQPVA